MTSQQDTELEKILDMFFDLPYPEYNMSLLPDEEGYDVVQERRNHEERYAREEIAEALTSWKDKEVKKAQLGMIEYYDQVTNNKDMDWKGLFADNRKQIQYELESLQSQGGK